MNGTAFALALSLAVSGASAGATTAAAKVVVDASCDGNGGYMLGQKAYAESFTVGHAGKLVSGFVETYNVHDQDAVYPVEIWAADAFGLPTGPAPLASTTIDHPHYGYNFDYPAFPTPLAVKAGQTYVLVVTVPDPANNGLTVIPGNVCAGTFSLNATGAQGAFTPDASHRDMEFAIDVAVKHRHHHKR